ncbi:MAG: hypothetical protein K2Z81_04295 [Cyanobacteria bacterium]|nr:hypothetical protein [Cyanobacteriota bacterium]
MIQRIQYKTRLVTFVDVMGFGDLVYLSKDNEELANNIYATVMKIRTVEDMFATEDSFFQHTNFHELTGERRELALQAYAIAQEMYQENRVQVTTFSDSIVLSAAMSSQGIAGLRFCLAKLVSYVSSFKLLLRGGVSHGSLYHDDQVIFGPALNDAYFLESKRAVVPRIVVNPESIEAIKEIQADSVFLGEVRQDDDEHYFLDVLSYGVSKIAQNFANRDPHLFLQDLKSAVEISYERYKHDDRISQKLRWFAEYFNGFVERTKTITVTIKDLDGHPLRDEEHELSCGLININIPPSTPI